MKQSGNRSRKIRLGTLLTLLAIVCVFALSRYFRSQNGPQGLPTKGGETLFIEIECPYFFQRDPEWRADLIGDSDCSLGGYGCTISAAAMALNALKVPCTPKSLNAALSASSGFTADGLLVWDSLRRFAGDSFTMVVKEQTSHAYLDSQLKAGVPVIAKVLWRGQVWHWVLITGKKGDQYLIADPLVPADPHMPATAYAEGFFAIRHLQPR